MSASAPPAAGLAAAEWSVWTTTARVVVTDAGALLDARTLVAEHLARVDEAASRFREDSEVSRLARTGDGRPRAVSPLLAELVGAALAAAARTGGDVDPTLGAVLAGLGYDRDLADLPDLAALDDGPAPGPVLVPTASPAAVVPRPRRSWRDVHLDGDLLSVPPGVLLDLGATAKAVAADACATAVAARFGCGALVSLGGDLRTAGPAPEGGWQVLVQDGPDEPASSIALAAERAVATSSTLHRTWRSRAGLRHHVVDPSTGQPAPAVWRTVTVSAPTCAEANTLTTAAVVRGRRAPDLLAPTGLPARLVAADGTVLRLGGWPEAPAAAPA